jgi:hypothetical protein
VAGLSFEVSALPAAGEAGVDLTSSFLSPYSLSMTYFLLEGGISSGRIFVITPA